jgi:hypothetical protein
VLATATPQANAQPHAHGFGSKLLVECVICLEVMSTASMAHCVFYVCGHYICQNDFERLMQMEVADDSQVVTRLQCLPLHSSRVFMFGANRCTDVQFAARPLSPKQGEIASCLLFLGPRVLSRVFFARQGVGCTQG